MIQNKNYLTRCRFFFPFRHKNRFLLAEGGFFDGIISLVKEIWRDIPAYEGRYKISNFGRVVSLCGNKMRILNPVKDTKGYLIVKLYGGGIRKTFRVHRIVGLVFVENPFGMRTINHKDGDKKNNRSDNLEWCSQSENILHSVYVLKNNHGRNKIRRVLCVETGVVYNGLREAERLIGVSNSRISLCLLGKLETAGGYHWKYAPEP